MKMKTTTGSMEIGTTFTTTLICHDEKTLAERVGEAYKYDLEPEETDFLNRAAEQFGRRLSSQE